jgi:pyrophosphatase PpaX
MKNYDAYLFDWDGTLARTLEIWIDQLHARYTEYGLLVTKEQAAKGFGNLKSPLQYGLPIQQLSEFQEGVNAAVKQRLPDVPLYDDAYETLVALKKQGKKLALVTTSLRHNLDVVMGKHGVEVLFDIIVTSEDVKKHKPDPESINLVLERFGVGRDRAIMLGDSSHDLLAAQNAGIDSALFYPEAHSLIHDLNYLQSQGPTHTLCTWRELLDQLQ